MSDEACHDAISDVDGTPIAVTAAGRPRARHRLARRLPLRHDRHQGRNAGRVRRRASGLAFLRHDYSGHGDSGGAFADGTISSWLGESLAVFRRFAPARAILVGSSMGAWIALRMVEELRKAGEDGRIAGLVLLAPAPDFTTELIEPAADQEAEEGAGRKGLFRGAVGLFRRAQCLHQGADRGRRGEPRADRADRHALPGPHPAGPGRSRRAGRAMR